MQRVDGWTVDSSEFHYSITPAGALVSTGVTRVQRDRVKRIVTTSKMEVRDVSIDARQP
jgi:hypothetical protein